MTAWTLPTWRRWRWVGLLGLMLAFLKFFDASRRIATLRAHRGLQQAQVARIAALETALAHMADTLKPWMVARGIQHGSDAAASRRHWEQLKGISFP